MSARYPKFRLTALEQPKEKAFTEGSTTQSVSTRPARIDELDQAGFFYKRSSRHHLSEVAVRRNLEEQFDRKDLVARVNQISQQYL